MECPEKFSTAFSFRSPSVVEGAYVVRGEATEVLIWNDKPCWPYAIHTLQNLGHFRVQEHVRIQKDPQGLLLVSIRPEAA